MRLSEVLCCAVFCDVRGVMSLFWSGEGEQYKPAVCARGGGAVFAQPSKMKRILQTYHWDNSLSAPTTGQGGPRGTCVRGKDKGGKEQPSAGQRIAWHHSLIYAELIF